QVRGRRVRDGAPAPEGEDQALPRRDSGPGPPQQPPQGRQQTGEPEAVPGPHVAMDDGAFRGRPECARCGGLNPEYKGFGTGLKPGHESVVMDRKPMATTVAANVLEHGTGAINNDACSISAGDGDDLNRARISGFSDSAIYGTSNGYGMQAAPSGRWPANVILDEHMAGALDEQSGVLKSGARTPTGGEQKGDVYGLGHKTSGTNTFASSE